MISTRPFRTPSALRELRQTLIDSGALVPGVPGRLYDPQFVRIAPCFALDHIGRAAAIDEIRVSYGTARGEVH